jgi:hypothetical protein
MVTIVPNPITPPNTTQPNVVNPSGITVVLVKILESNTFQIQLNLLAGSCDVTSGMADINTANTAAIATKLKHDVVINFLLLVKPLLLSVMIPHIVMATDNEANAILIMPINDRLRNNVIGVPAPTGVTDVHKD